MPKPELIILKTQEQKKWGYQGHQDATKETMPRMPLSAFYYNQHLRFWRLVQWQQVQSSLQASTNHMSLCNSFLMVRFLRNANRTKIACSQRLRRIQLWRFQAYHSFLTKLGIGSIIFSLSLSFWIISSHFFLYTFALVIWPDHVQG